MATRGLTRALLVVAVALTVLLPAAALAAPAATGGPSPARIRLAVDHMRRSRSLWTTVNVCNTARHPHQIGVRAQMPRMGFPTRMALFVAVQYWDADTARWRTVTGPNASYTARFPFHGAPLEQAGSNFTFAGYTGRLRGLVTFTWRRAGRVLLRLTRPTGAKHPDAVGGDPPNYSAADCVL